MIGLGLLLLSLLSSPASQEFCTSGLVATHVAHEWSHDLAFLAQGKSPYRPGALWGDKWQDETVPARAGVIGQLLLVGATQDPCLSSSSRVYWTVYVIRAGLAPGQAGDFSTWIERGGAGAVLLGIGTLLDIISSELHELQ